jgi:hypothetical protein
MPVSVETRAQALEKGVEPMGTRGVWIILSVLVLLVATASVASAAPLHQEAEDLTSNPLWIALAPLLAIATAIERLMEMFWERWERAKAWPNREGVPQQDLETARYKEFKKGSSHWLGFGLALIAIAFADVRFFHLLGLDVLFSQAGVLFSLDVGGIFDDFTLGTLIDWVGTALVIGWGGTELAHSIIVGLVRGRKLWEEMEEVKKGEKSILDLRFFQEEIAPELEKRGIPVSTLRQALQTLDRAGVSVDELIGQLTQGTAEVFLRDQGEAGAAMLAALEGTPEAQPNPVEVGKILDKIAPDLRKRFLGA